MNSPAERFIDKYEIVSTLGRGSMGVVYKGRDPEIGRMVAIKTLKTLFLGDDPAGNEALQRFRQESRSAGKLHHKNIVTIFEAGRTGNGSPYIVMEYIEGDSLEALIARKKPLDSHAVVHYISQIADAVDYAHVHNVIHRDIKPSNILVDNRHKPYLLDFGVAKLSDTSLTPAGTVVGTPSYMSPEQIRGLPLDGRTDLFSLAVVAFESLLGVRPFPGDDFTTVVNNIMHKPPLSFRDLGSALSPDVEAVLKRALAKERNDRFPTAKELARALAQAVGVRADESGIFGGYTEVAQSEVLKERVEPKAPASSFPGIDDDDELPGIEFRTPMPKGNGDLAMAARMAEELAESVREAPRQPAVRAPISSPSRPVARPPQREALPEAPINGIYDELSEEVEYATTLHPKAPAVNKKSNRPSGSHGSKRSSGVRSAPRSGLSGSTVILTLVMVLLGAGGLWYANNTGLLTGITKTDSGDEAGTDSPIGAEDEILVERGPLGGEPALAADQETTAPRRDDSRQELTVAPTAVPSSVPAIPTVPLGGFTRQSVASMPDAELVALLRWKGAEPEAIRTAVNEAASRELPVFFAPMTELLGRDSLVIRVAVLKALRNSKAIDRPEVQAAVITSLSDRDHVIRGFAAIALERISSAEAQAALEKQLSREDNADIRKVIARVLRRG